MVESVDSEHRVKPLKPPLIMAGGGSGPIVGTSARCSGHSTNCRQS